jgi:hypothetical protein
MNREQTDEVIQRYVTRYLDRQKRRPHRPHPRVPEDQAVARKFLAWCDEKLVDPLQLIDLRFEHLWRERKACPRFNSLRSERLVHLARRTEASVAAASTQVEVFDQTVRDLTLVLPGQEQVRRRYYFQQQQELCLENGMSGGYEPRSHFCPNCPQAATCASRLNEKWGFDVVALRSGKLGAVPAAVRKALRGWDGRVSV